MNFFLFHTHSSIFKPFSSCRRLLSTIALAWKESNKAEPLPVKGLDDALKLLHLINPKTTSIQSRENHLRLIQDCLVELSQKDAEQRFNPRNKDTQELFDEILDWGSMTNHKILRKEDAFLLFVEMHSEGMKADAITLSGVLSSCGILEALKPGVQLHALATKTGFDLHVSVGSSLISFYAKCQLLDHAHQVFENMPVRNTVSWTAIISGFAQYWQVGMCLKLFHLMRRSTLRPNDFTFASLLSVCTGIGFLGQGRIAHCQTIQMGFDSYTHVANALISMYAKCGSIEAALYVFAKMTHKDLISWNSMIMGYSQHGLADQAIRLFKDMLKHKIVPDAITFLGVLSSCRHAGLIEEGRLCFDSMFEHGVEPELDHYSCIVDLLGRAGLLQEAYEFIQKMPIQPNAIIWGSLLSSCRLHGNIWIGIKAAENRLLFEPGCAAAHVQLANLYASSGCWNHVAKVRKLMKERGLKPSTGYSWIEIRNEVFRFRAEDRSNTNVNEIFFVVDSLAAHMRNLGYVGKIKTSMHEGVKYD